MAAREVQCPIDYNHQLLLATRRPSKLVKSHPKRYGLKAKSLSFESSPEKMMPESVSSDSTNSGCDFEESFSLITQKSLSLQSLSCLPINQPDSANPGTGANENYQAFSYVPSVKIYPRRNYDHQ